jgi:CBS domain-containing protein
MIKVRNFSPAQNAGKIVGIISDRDLRTAAESSFLHKTTEEKIKSLAVHIAENVMSKSVVSIEPESPIVILLSLFTHLG